MQGKPHNPPSVTFVDENRFAPGWRFGRHVHRDSGELQYVLDGKLSTWFEGRLHRAGPGQVVIHPPGIAHEEAVHGSRPVMSIYVSWIGGPLSAQLPLVCTDHDGRIQSAVRWMLGAFSSRGRTAGPLLDALMLAVLDEAMVATTQSDNLQARVTRFVRAHMDEPISLNDLAKDSAMSRWHFCRRYREEANCTPMDTVRQVRVDAARHMLATTTLTVEAVAAKVGFPDRFHFSRMFKKITGQTPASIRQ